MCEITVKCTKCEKAVSSITNKIRTLKKSIRRNEGKKQSQELIKKLSSEIDGLEWSLKALKKYCECDIRSWHEKNGYEK